jgi:deoxyribonuclease V
MPGLFNSSECSGTDELSGRFTVEKAISAQILLRERWINRRVIETEDIHSIAGADAAVIADKVHAAVVTMSYPGLRVTGASCADAGVFFPYIPGLLAFREGPAIVKAFRRLEKLPDIILIKGHGLAHPRRFGMASQIGVILNVPTIGVAKSLLIGNSTDPQVERGSITPVIAEGERIGMAIRTRKSVKPLYVSVGHKTDIDQAVEVVLSTTSKYRTPEPLRLAHELALRGTSSKNDYPGSCYIF